MRSQSNVWRVVALTVVAAASIAAGGQYSWRPETLVDVVRASTSRFGNSEEAVQAGYLPMPACVAGPEEGAMGIHFVNGALVGDGQLDAQAPEALIYEAKDGRLRFVGVEFIVLADAWHSNNAAPPVLMGQQFHYIGSPNRYGNPPFYELHVWAWRHNPKGTFADWNPRVSCAEFTTDGPVHASSH